MGCAGAYGSKAVAQDDLEELIAAISAAAQHGDHILVMSNGGLGRIRGKLLQRLARQYHSALPPAAS